MRLMLVGTLLALPLLQLSTAAQEPNRNNAVAAAGAARVSGVVLRSGRTDPLPKATVQLSLKSTGAIDKSITTNSEGRFNFMDLAPGTYQLMATYRGYAPSERYDVTIASGEAVDKTISMTLGGFISGRVTSRGGPLAKASVLAQRVSFSCDGRQILESIETDTTDDRGEYSLFWLAPGLYYVAVTVPSSEEERKSLGNPLPRNPERGPNAGGKGGNAPQLEEIHAPLRPLNAPTGSHDAETTLKYVMSYAPHTQDWRTATMFVIEPGKEITNVNIDASPVRVAHIRGTVSGVPAGPRGQGTRPALKLTHADLGAVIDAQAETNGAFEIPVATPGSYVLTATARRASAQLLGGELLAGHTSIDVRGGIDMSGVSVALAPGFHLSVKLEIDNRIIPGASGLAALGLLLRPDPMFAGATEYPFVQVFDADDPPANLRGSYDLSMPAGDYRVLVDPIQTCLPVAAPAGLRQVVADRAYVKSIRMGDRDVLNDGLQLKEQPRNPLVIAIGTSGSVLNGRAVDAKGRPVASGTVVLIPEGNQRFNVQHKVAPTDQAGAFQLRGIAPGKYKLFAWQTVERFGWQNREFMRAYEEYGKPVQIPEGETKNIEGDVLVIASP